MKNVYLGNNIVVLIDGIKKTLKFEARIGRWNENHTKMIDFSHFQFNELNDRNIPIRAHNFSSIPGDKKFKTNGHEYLRLS